MVAPPFSDDTTTEIFGQRIAEGNGDSANARVTVSRAGFGVRSRVVNPNAQSSTGYCPWYHSSVHANTMTPEQPRRNAARTCQSNVAAWDPSPFRRLSSPIDRKSTRLNSSHLVISYAVFC